MASPQYETHVFHINVGVGDCSLILVRDTTRTVNPVIKAVLIDGSQSAWKMRIWPWIQALQKLDQYKAFTLSAVIITHYDEDHLRGIVQMLDMVREADEKEQIAKTTNPSYARPPGSILDLFPQTTHLTQRTRIYDVGVYKTPVDIGTLKPTNVYQQYLNLVGNPGASLPNRGARTWHPFSFLIFISIRPGSRAVAGSPLVFLFSESIIYKKSR